MGGRAVVVGLIHYDVFLHILSLFIKKTGGALSDHLLVYQDMKGFLSSEVLVGRPESFMGMGGLLDLKCLWTAMCFPDGGRGAALRACILCNKVFAGGCLHSGLLVRDLRA